MVDAELPPVPAPAAPAPASAGKKKAPASDMKPKAAPRKAAGGPKKVAKHPAFGAMIAEAISTLKERSGSSVPAIRKAVGSKYAKDLPANWEKMLSTFLKRLTASGKLTKVKASYKLGEEMKKKPAAPKKKAAATTKKAAAPKKAAAAPKKPSGVKKPKAAPKKKAAAPKK